MIDKDTDLESIREFHERKLNECADLLEARGRRFWAEMLRGEWRRLALLHESRARQQWAMLTDAAEVLVLALEPDFTF